MKLKVKTGSHSIRDEKGQRVVLKAGDTFVGTENMLKSNPDRLEPASKPKAPAKAKAEGDKE